MIKVSLILTKHSGYRGAPGAQGSPGSPGQKGERGNVSFPEGTGIPGQKGNPCVLRINLPAVTAYSQSYFERCFNTSLREAAAASYSLILVCVCVLFR